MMTRTRHAALIAILVLGALQAAPRAASFSVCASGCTYSNLQTALDAMACGDTLTLKAGETYTGYFTAANKGCAADITVRSDATLPAAGVRIGPSNAALLPKIQTAGAASSALTVAISATHWTFRGLEFPPGGLAGNRAFIIIGAGDSTQYSEAQEPDYITVDQVYIHGDRLQGGRVGIETEGKHVTISDSYISQMAGMGQDAQAIFGFNARGPVRIINNYLEAAGENVIFGGGDPLNHVYMTATGSATTTGAAVATSEGHLLSDVKKGQRISILTTGGTKLEHSTVVSVTGTGTTGSITFDALTAAPTIPGGLRTGAVVQFVRIAQNYLTKNVAWKDPIIPAPASASAVASTTSGTLAAGTKYYQVQNRNSNGYQGNVIWSNLSPETFATLGATGRIDLSWPSAADSTPLYRVFRGTSAGNENEWAETASLALSDNGSVTWTAGAPVDSGGSPCGVAGCGRRWNMKNLGEIKTALDATVVGNIFEYSQSGVDIGYFFWLKSNNQDGNCWFCETARFTFALNLVRHVPDGILISGIECSGGCSATNTPHVLTDVTFSQNLLYDVNHLNNEGFRQYPGSDGFVFETVNGPVNLTVDHNTLLRTSSGSGTGGFWVMDHTTTHGSGWKITNNIGVKGDIGIYDAGVVCTAALDAYTPGYIWTNNALADFTATGCPPSPPNFYATLTALQAEFVNYSLSGNPQDYKLKATSAYHLAGTDGKDLGADVTAVLAATAGVLTGTPPSGIRRRPPFRGRD